MEDSTSVNSEHQSGNKLVNVAPEDTAARRIFAKEKLEKETEIKAQVEKKLEKKRRDTISLEAKEIVKYFDASSGGASTTLDLENINQSLDPGVYKGPYNLIFFPPPFLLNLDFRPQDFCPLPFTLPHLIFFTKAFIL